MWMLVAAAFGDVFVTGGKRTTSSLTLGNVKDFTFDVTVHNLSSAKEFITIRSLIRIKENGCITLKMRQLTGSRRRKTIHVPAMEVKQVPISCELISNYTSESPIK